MVWFHVPSFFRLFRKLRQEIEMDTCATRFNPSMLWNFDKASKRRSHKWRRLLLSEANCTLSSVITKEILTCRCTFSFTFPIHLSQSNFQTNYERLQTRLGCSTFLFATSFQDRVHFRLTCTTANRDTKVTTQETFRTNQSALWANSWIDTWFFWLCLMLSGLGNFVVDCHI